MRHPQFPGHSAAPPRPSSDAWSRRDLLIAGAAGASALAVPGWALGEGPPALDGVAKGTAAVGDQGALVDAYWDGLPVETTTAEERWRVFQGAAEEQGKLLALDKPVVHAYLDLADRLRAGESETDPSLVSTSGRDIATMPRKVEAVPVSISTFNNRVEKVATAVEKTQRFIMPFLSATPVGPAVAGAFEVLDLSFKAAAWIGANADYFRGRSRTDVNPRVVPATRAVRTAWTSPTSKRTIEGLMHQTVRGQIFVSRELVVDAATGVAYHVVGIRQSGDIADEGTVRMVLLKLLEG